LIEPFFRIEDAAPSWSDCLVNEASLNIAIGKSQL